MKKRFPNIYPVFQVVPFQHLYQRLLEEVVDVVAAFRGSGEKKAIHYRELAKIPAIGIAKAGHPLAQAGKLSLKDLKKEPLIALNPQKCHEDYRKIIHRVLEEKSPSDVYFCDAAEMAVALAGAGYGIAVVPDFFQLRDPNLSYLPIADAQPMSYGVYYKTLAGNPRCRAFVELVKEAFEDAGKEGDPS